MPTTKKSSSPKSGRSRSSRPKSGSSRSSSSKAKSSSAKTSTSKTASRKSNGKGIIASAVDAVAGIFSTGTPNAVGLLKSDHDKVEKLFEKVKANENGNNAATFRRIKEELDVHTHIEETIFYPHLLEKGDKELKKVVREGIEEHRQVKMFLAELDTLSGEAVKFKAKLEVLMEDVEHHVKEEEDEMFPMVEDQIPEEVLQRLGSRMKAEKIKVKKMGGPPKTNQRASAATQR